MTAADVALPRTIGVVGAGTMGAGIAQLACVMGAQTLLHDPEHAALERGAAQVATGLDRLVTRGRLDQDARDAALARVEPAPRLEDLAPCDLIIEAAPERLDVKAEIFGRLSREIARPNCVIASNTSSIPITAIAATAEHPERVVGMHFFNPAPVMKLVEVIAAIQTSGEALQLAQATGEAMGKRVIIATDGPGFLVNRCGRPFGLEALRALQEQLADVETIDRIVRLGGGFRMGPFELQDLVGIDTGFAVAQSFAELSFGEPRWRPSPLSAQLVAAGRLGRKSGRGWYSYADGTVHRPADAAVPAHPGGGGRLVTIAGDFALADALRDLAAQSGWDARDPEDAAGELPFLIVDAGGPSAEEPSQGGPQALLCAEGSLAELDQGGSATGFHALPPLQRGGLVELTRSYGTSDLSAARSGEFFGSLGLHTAWVGDAPGLVLGRLVAQLVNEAAFAIGEGVGTADDIDAGMMLGLNHPRGPLAWGDEIGLDHVLAILDALLAERGDPAYRAAPSLRRLVAEGRVGEATGAGFHAHSHA